MGKSGFEVIGLMPNVRKDDVLRVAGEVAAWLRRQGKEVRLLSEDAQAMGLKEQGMDRESFMRGLDLVISLGGDGAMLRAVALACEAQVPVVGVNLGKKGFLTAIDADRVYPGLEEVFAGHCLIQERMMLACTVIEEGKEETHYALNEVVVGKRELQSMIRLEVDINGRYFHFYSGDGVIFSTPTGSTGYSLSSGGPIVDPDLDCIILTPVCSHSLLDRSVIISPQSEISVLVRREKVMPSLSFDGREEIGLPGGGHIIIRRAERRVGVIQLPDYNFYQLLRDKFNFPQDE